MKNYKMAQIFNKGVLTLVLGGMIFFTACKKNDTDVAIGKVFINNQLYPVNEYKFDFSLVMDGTNNTFKETTLSGDTLYKFPAKITVPAKEKVVLNCGLIENYLTSYNKDNKSSYLILSPENYIIEKNQVTINPGELISKDSFIVRLAIKRKADITAADYLLPLQISSTSNNTAIISSNLSIIKIFGSVGVLVLNDNIAPGNVIPVSEFIDRNLWSISTSSTYSKFVAQYMLDGNKATGWDSNNESRRGFGLIDVDMQKVNTINGLQIAPNLVYLEDNSDKIEILSSVDKRKWESQGTYTYTGPALTAANKNSPDVLRNINFKKAVSARYLRLKMFTDGYTGAGELNVF